MEKTRTKKRGRLGRNKN